MLGEIFSASVAAANHTVLNHTWFSASHHTDNPLDHNRPLQYFYVVCLAFQSVFGSIGNILVIGAVCTVPALRTTGNAFIINLSLADLLVTSVTQPGNIVGALFGQEWWQDRPALCSVVATICATGCLSSCWNILMIAVNRYIMICYFEYYEKIYTKTNTVLICLLVWIIIYGLELPNHFGWGDNRFSVVFFMCTFANHLHSYALFFILVGVAPPIIASFVCYMAIYQRVKHSHLVRNQILNKTEVGPKEDFKKPMSRRRFHENVKVAKALFRVYLIFLLMWAPVAVVIVMGKGTSIDYVWYILTVLMAHGNSSINCVVYAASLEHFRVGYCKLLGIKRRTVKATETDMSTTNGGIQPRGKAQSGGEHSSSNKRPSKDPESRDS